MRSLATTVAVIFIAAWFHTSALRSSDPMGPWVAAMMDRTLDALSVEGVRPPDRASRLMVSRKR